MINYEIKSDVVNLVSEKHGGLTKINTSDAIKIAEEEGLDLVCINSKSDIPVVKIMDYNKYMYDKAKKEKENKKKARLNSQELKEIQLSDSIALHDLKVKAANIDRLLTAGNKVKVVIKYKGRSIRLIGQGPNKLIEVTKLLKSFYKIDKEPYISGNQVIMILSKTK